MPVLTIIPSQAICLWGLILAIINYSNSGKNWSSILGPVHIGFLHLLKFFILAPAPAFSFPTLRPPSFTLVQFGSLSSESIDVALFPTWRGVRASAVLNW